MQIFTFEINLILKFCVLFYVPLFYFSTSFWDDKTIILSTWLVITEEARTQTQKYC